MYQIAVLGDAQSVQGFAALGLQVCPAENAEQARPILHRLAKDGLIVVADIWIPALAVHAVLQRNWTVTASRPPLPLSSSPAKREASDWGCSR